MSAGDERSSDTAETFGSQDLPGAVSDQNAEEAEGGQSGAGPSQSSEDGSPAEQNRRSEGDEDSPSGASGEGSQSTGNPAGAG